MNTNETTWLQPRTRRMLDGFCEGIDIAPVDRTDYNGEVEITFDGVKAKVYLGDLTDVSDSALDRRFCAAFLSFARIYMGNSALAKRNNLFKVADILLKNHAAA